MLPIKGPVAKLIPRLSAGAGAMGERIAQRVRNRASRDLPRPLRLYRRDSLVMAYVWLDAADGVITLKVGNLGHPAECARYDAAQWPRIRDHLDHLRDTGFAEIPASEMAYLHINYPLSGGTADADERSRRDALITRIAEHLARTGQGAWADSATGDGRMGIGFHVVDFDIGCTTLADLLEDGTLGTGVSIERHAEPAFDNDRTDIEPEPPNPDAQPARIRPRRVTRERFADLAPAS